ncbi:MAG: hypothetical protein ACYS74_13515 [Planctomycetota bacterium]|jgi:hypothetical protein
MRIAKTDLKKQSQFASRGLEIRSAKPETLNKEAIRQSVILKKQSQYQTGKIFLNGASENGK